MTIVKRTDRQRGEGRLGLIIAVAVVGAAIFAAVQYVPVRVTAYQFRDFIEQECRMAAVRDGDEAVRERILDKAIELRIPLDKTNLKLQRTRSEMIISASYTHPIDFKVTRYDFRFEHEERAPLF